MKNSKGKIYYGMHFCPGVAEYHPEGKEPFRVFINEDTIRSMNPTFAGKPIFVDHVDEVASKVDEIKKIADGWVIESFFNSADGKTWVKFIVVSEKGERAISQGYRLSNAYYLTSEGPGGEWNGVSFAKQVQRAEYEHLAIVKNPRYEESVIMTPDEFKSYNNEKELELTRLANSKEKETGMKLSLFKKAKVDNSADFESMSVTLPKSGKEKTLIQLVNEADEMEEKMKKNDADPKAMVKLHDGSVCNVAELVEKHKALHDEHEAMKAKMVDSTEMEEDLAPTETPVEVEGDMANTEEEEGQKDGGEPLPKKDESKEKKMNAETKEEKQKRFENLKNAHINPPKKEEIEIVDFSGDQVARGKARYGSGK